MVRPDRLADLLARARGLVDDITVEQLIAQRDRVTIVDVREATEYAEGALDGALHLPRGQLEFSLPSEVEELDTPLVVICATGRRSLLAAHSLRELGYSNVRSLAGGFEAWKLAGAPWVQPQVLSGSDAVRYQRHLVLPDIGVSGQMALGSARVAVVGAGGLGSAAAIYLAAAGVGTIRLIDDDVVSLSNLQRQVLHADGDIGVPKVHSAAQTLAALNPEVRIETFCERLTRDSAERLLAEVDVVIDGSDNFETTFVLNDLAVALSIPTSLAGVLRFDAQLTTVMPGGPCYRCLIPSGPANAPSCAEAGVVGALVGVVGAWQALEAIKILTGAGDVLRGRLLVLDGLTSSLRELSFDRDGDCPAGH
jgi:molybdopterin/thiamine biosynthesis adenylyltransferase/rhodanese-related sulfurtransferase